MKKTILTILAGGLCLCSFGQNDTTNDAWENNSGNVVLPTGNVGVGTTSPTEKLEVEGDAKFLTGASKLLVTGSGIQDNTIASVRVSSGNMVLNAKSGGTLYFNRDNGDDVRIQQNATDIAVFNSTGVGINTSTLSATLDVNGDAKLLSGINQLHIYQGVAVTATTPSIRINNGSMVLNTSSGGTLYLNRDNGNEVRIQQNATDIAVFSADGVGIKTDCVPTGYALAVKGSVICEELKVQLEGGNCWADYVFDEGYMLKDLSKVKEYIDENGHLPNVPSAETVENEGITVSEMLRIQMEKIEELTLYMIDLKAENDVLKQQIEEQLKK